MSLLFIFSFSCFSTAIFILFAFFYLFLFLVFRDKLPLVVSLSRKCIYLFQLFQRFYFGFFQRLHIFLIFLNHLLPFIIIHVSYLFDSHQPNFFNIMVNFPNIKRLSTHKNLFILFLTIIAARMVSENASNIGRPTRAC